MRNTYRTYWGPRRLSFYSKPSDVVNPPEEDLEGIILVEDGIILMEDGYILRESDYDGGSTIDIGIGSLAIGDTFEVR